MRKVQKDWFARAAGRRMNPDQYAGLQCKDVADDYCEAIFKGKPWHQTIRPGNGKDVLFNANRDYFDVIWNDGSPGLIPKAGDIISWAGSEAVPEGHVAPCLSATRSGPTVLEQDGYAQTPTKRVTYGSYQLPSGGMCLGWLRPKASKMPADPKPKPKAKPKAKRLTAIPKGHPRHGEFWVKVAPGNTLSGLAKWQRTTVEKVLKLNPQIDDQNRISVGEILRLK